MKIFYSVEFSDGDKIEMTKDDDGMIEYTVKAFEGDEVKIKTFRVCDYGLEAYEKAIRFFDVKCAEMERARGESVDLGAPRFM